MTDPAMPPDRPAPALERRLATILAADVAGYSRMMGQNEEATVQTLRDHRSVFDSLLAQHHGRVFNTAGDMILAEFPSAVEAVRCATEIQAALQTRNEHLPPERKMLFRMGINLGDVVVQQGDLLGDGVNVAARLQTVAEPGGICLSGSVYDQIRNKLSLHFRAMGEQKFKNIGQPVRTFTITSADVGGLPSTMRVPSGKSMWVMACAALVAIALAGGGYWAYRDIEAKRLAQSALAAQLDAQKQATDDARRAAEEQSRRAAETLALADRERQATEASKREATMTAQLQSAEEARRRAEADKKRIADQKQQAEEARIAAEALAAGAAKGRGAAKTAAVAAVTEPAPSAAGGDGVAKFDGTYTGEMCDFPANPDKRICWNVVLTVRNGVADIDWRNRLGGKEAHAHITIGPKGAVKGALDGYTRDGSPLPGAMAGHLADNHIDARGRWNNGIVIDGHWTRTP